MPNIGTRIILAPLSACSDLAYRVIAREYGAKFCFFEMIDAHSLVYDSPRANRILRTTPSDQPIAAQLLGLDQEVMLRAAEIILKRSPIRFLDINAACPARKVFKKGVGSCLFKNPTPLYELIAYLRERLPVPITVKMRVGLTRVDIPQAVQMAQGCQSAGASALFVHGRPRALENYGEVSYEAIRAVKQAVSIPVYGSGNVLNPPLAKKMLDLTGADGVLIAKGSFGNPFIFKEVEDYLQTGLWTPRLNILEKLSALKKHLLLAKDIDGERLNLRIGEMGKICLWYLKGFQEASRLRTKVFASRNSAELFDLINSLEDAAAR